MHFVFRALAILTMIFICSHLTVSAQKNLAPGRRDTLITRDSSVEEKLVKLALEGPLMKSADHENRINDYRLIAAKNSWLNILSVSLNYNEQSFSKNLQGPSVYPKYFFGVTIPLGTIFSRTEIKAARESVELGKLSREQLERNIRAAVLTKYRQYLSYSELIVYQNQIADDAQALFQQIERRFKEGDKTVTVEAYTLASRVANEETTKKLELILQQDLAKIELERMIGVPLENVTR